MHQSLRILAAVSVLLSAATLRAQTLFPDRDEPLHRTRPLHENVRLAWLIDADDGVDDEWAGFELAYAAKVYPLDQMILSYARTDPEGLESHAVMLSIEEHYPVSDTLVPYGVAGLGYRWADFDGDSKDGWYGKIGGGLLLKLCEAAGVYGEVSYQGGGTDLWLDDDDTTSHNVVALIGVRFFY